MRERLHVKVAPTTIDGVRAFIVTPDEIPPEHRDKLIVHVHGGCYVFSPGEAATPEALILAGMGHYKVISVDYRMPPEAYYPAALDDALTVYKAAIKMTAPKNVAIEGGIQAPLYRDVSTTRYGRENVRFALNFSYLRFSSKTTKH